MWAFFEAENVGRLAGAPGLLTWAFLPWSQASLWWSLEIFVPNVCPLWEKTYPSTQRIPLGQRFYLLTLGAGLTLKWNLDTLGSKYIYNGPYTELTAAQCNTTEKTGDHCHPFGCLECYCFLESHAKSRKGRGCTSEPCTIQGFCQPWLLSGGWGGESHLVSPFF